MTAAGGLVIPYLDGRTDSEACSLANKLCEGTNSEAHDPTGAGATCTTGRYAFTNTCSQHKPA